MLTGAYVGVFTTSYNASNWETTSVEGSAAGLNLGGATVSRTGNMGLTIGGDLNLGVFSIDNAAEDTLFLYSVLGYAQIDLFLGPEGNLAISLGAGIGYEGLVGDFLTTTITYDYVPLRLMAGAKFYMQNLMLFADLYTGYHVGVSVTIDDTTFPDADPVDFTVIGGRVGVCLLF